LDNDVFVLLDDCHATASTQSSRLFTGFVREHCCTDPQALDTLWLAIEADQRSGLQAAIFADYEWGAKLQQAGMQHVLAGDTSALRVLMFQGMERLSAEAVGLWLAQQDGCDTPSVAGICDLQTGTDQQGFEDNVERIQALIRSGETYQVNYTLRMKGWQYGKPIGLYRRLRAMQPVTFGVFALLPATPGAANDTTQADGNWVLSCSPELFVRNRSIQLTARPMKGTAARLANAAADQERAHWLAHDSKNRAENVMIVDLLRNDLGRISKTGSVTVPKLFDVETYKTVHQMTSTVTASLRDGVNFPEVLRALFPCGSITGAPKLHTMDLIAELESSTRGLYCGAIGWLDKPSRQSPAGDFCLSVAIRTIVLGAEHAGRRGASIGVGNGIVMDSKGIEEFSEIKTKMRYLTSMDPGFTLFETMRVNRGRLRNLKQHLHRLRTSAHALGFTLHEIAVHEVLAARLQSLDEKQSYRLRLDLQHDGLIRVQTSLLAPLPPGPARLVLAANPVPSGQTALLNHKTSLRSSYDAAILKAIDHQAFDTIFLNPQAEVTEGARSSLFVKMNGQWCTPPLSRGVLAGVMRQRLLERFPTIVEKVLSLDDVLTSEQLVVCSALRGLQQARWLKDATGELLRV
jgi:para-aminobenzoate synthetase/4-amino-4-deoxychorismate lyase